MTVRAPAAAGRHPPDGELHALVAPHAGYIYCGTVAATAFAPITAADAWRTALGSA